MIHRLLLACLITSSLLFCGACSVHQVQHDRSLPDTVPSDFSRSGAIKVPDQWWIAFNNETLNTLVEKTLEQNLDLKASWARLDQMQALAVSSGSQLKPQLSLNTDASKLRIEQFSDSAVIDSIGLSLFTSYELDLWNRIQSQRNAALVDLTASAYDLESTAQFLAAQVATRWINIIEQQAQLDLLEEQLQTGETYVELNELRFSQGKSTAVAVYQQRSQVASIRSQFPLSESAIEVLKHQLALLQGLPPKTDLPVIQSEFPDLPPLPHLGFPANVLFNRPDVQASYQRIISADYRIASAIADQFPAIRLTAQAGIDGSSLDDLFSNWFGSLAAGLTAPLLDGGRRKAEVQRNQAILKERLIQFEKTVLTALREVEDALIQEKKQTEYAQRLNQQLEISRATLDAALNRFVKGLSTYLPVLAALTDVQRLERQLLTTERNRILYRMNLYQALGGNWMNIPFIQDSSNRTVSPTGDPS